MLYNFTCKNCSNVTKKELTGDTNHCYACNSLSFGQLKRGDYLPRLESDLTLCFTCKDCGNSFNGIGYKKSLCFPDFTGKAFTYYCQDCATRENEKRGYTSAT